MDDLELLQAGQSFRVGEDLYGISVVQLVERLEVLAAEKLRIERAIAQKNTELTTAETFFRKS